MAQSAEALHHQWRAAHAQATQSRTPFEQGRSIHAIKRVESETKQLTPEELRRFAQGYRERIAHAPDEEREGLDYEIRNSPVLVAGFNLLLEEAGEKPATRQISPSEMLKGKEARRFDVYTAAKRETLFGNEQGLETVLQDVETRGSRRAAFNPTALTNIIVGVGKNRNNEVMTSTQAIESLRRSAHVIGVRVTEAARHENWQQPSEREKKLWEKIQRVAAARMLQHLQSGNHARTDELLQRVSPEKITIDEILQAMKTQNGGHDRITVYEIVQRFGEVLADWRQEQTKLHEQQGSDFRPSPDEVPPFGYDIPMGQSGLTPFDVPEQGETKDVPALSLRELAGAIGMLGAKNVTLLDFRGIPGLTIKFELRDDMRKVLDSVRKALAEYGNGYFTDSNARTDGINRMFEIIEQGDTAIFAQKISLGGDEDIDQKVTESIQELLLRIQEMEKEFGGRMWLKTFLADPNTTNLTHTIHFQGKAAPDISVQPWHGPFEMGEAVLLAKTTETQ